MRDNSILQRSSFLCCYILFSVLSHAQTQGQQRIEEFKKRILSDQKVKSVIFSKERETPLLISLRSDVNNYSVAQARVVLENFLSLRAGTDFLRIDKQSMLADDDEVIEFQQFFKGVKVDRAKYKAFAKRGSIKFFNGAFYTVPQTVNIRPGLSAEQALVYAKNRINAKRYAPDDIADLIRKPENAAYKLLLQKELNEASPNGELVIVQDFSKKAVSEVRLAYKFNIYASQPLSRSWVYVDANNGNILLVDAIIKHINEDAAPPVAVSVLATVKTRYAGNRNIYVKQITGNDPQNGLPLTSSHPSTETYVPGSPTWVLADDKRGNGIETYDLNGVGGLPISVAPAYTLAKSFTDVDNNWTVAEHKRGVEDGAGEAENDDIAWDAHWGAGIVYDYWKNKHNRLSYDGKNAKIKSFIHSGLAYDNAFWNGSVMTYGDGSGTAANGFKPLTSLDVCGHEIGHGVCSFTSDLVYANESGAMNEALSDIWAACVEYYAIKTVDPNLKSVYKPFYIGEQISANPSAPLRRMDDPKAGGNPDTYGGVNWTSQEGCTPTLANDQCGVHNNSGVLNKWFYLLTVGSGTGSGPDAAYAGTDDGINDAVTTGPAEFQHAANRYSVTGLGFSVAEKIAYLMENLLTSTATYKEARDVSISVATELSGNPCSAMVETVTNAWYAVGVGGKFVKPCTIKYGFISTGAGITEASSPAGCNSSKTFNIPVILPVGSTANITVSGTAKNGVDYTLSATSLSNTTTLPAKKTFVVTIKNDASVEGDETLILTLAVTNAGTNPVNKSYKLTIMDDDVVPVIGNGEKTLLSSTFTRADGFTDPSGWVEIKEIPEAPNGDPAASGKNEWGIFDNKLTITGKEGTTGATFPKGTYNSNSPSQTLIKSPLLDSRGLSTIKIKFDYTVQGEIDPQGADPENFPAFDYMALAYSLDGVEFVEINDGPFRQFASALPASGTINANLPASLTNKKFYLAFRWVNDTNAGGPFSASIDNLVISGAAKKIENDLNHNSRETLSAGQEVYFYSTQDNQVLGKVKNGSVNNFGCTNMYVEKTGNSTFNLYQGSDGLHKVGDKIVRIESSYIYNVSNTVTLFYTDQQLRGLETATGRGSSTFSVYVVNGPGYTSSTSANTKKLKPVYASFPGIGATYTVTFTGPVNGSYALGTTVSQPGARTFSPAIVEQNQIESNEWKIGNLYPNPGRTDLQFSVKAPVNEKIRIEMINQAGQVAQSQSMNVTKGLSNIRIQTRRLGAGNYLIYIKNEKGEVIDTQKYMKE